MLLQGWAHLFKVMPIDTICSINILEKTKDFSDFSVGWTMCVLSICYYSMVSRDDEL